VQKQVLEQVTVPKDGEQAALIEYLNTAGFSTTRIVVHDVTNIEHGSGDTDIDWVRNNDGENIGFGRCLGLGLSRDICARKYLCARVYRTILKAHQSFLKDTMRRGAGFM
jgi:hypothetical protein